VDFADQLALERKQKHKRPWWKPPPPEPSLFEKEICKHASHIRSIRTQGNSREKISWESAQSLRAFIENLEQEQRKHSWTRAISTRLQPLVEAISTYTGIIDTMTQADPSPSSLIWGAAKLCMQASQFTTERRIRDLQSRRF
jgi:hypothetical protein